MTTKDFDCILNNVLGHESLQAKPAKPVFSGVKKMGCEIIEYRTQKCIVGRFVIIINNIIIIILY